MIRRKAALAAAALLVGGLAGVSQAGSVISFDPDGLGADPTYNITTIDLAPGSVLAENIMPAIANPGTLVKFTEIYQADVAGLKNGNSPVVPPGLNINYELTAVVKHEAYALFNGTSLALSFASGPSTVEFYYDPARNAVPSAGTGFSDGTLILSASVVSFFGSFAVQPVAPVLLDQLGAAGAPYTNTTTVTGTGGFQLKGSTNFYDPNFFTGAPMNFSLVFPSGSSNLPFTNVDPAAAMWDGTVPVVGTTNGVPQGGGTDVLIESDAAATFEVPLPASVWGGLVGLMGLAAYRRSRR